MFIKGTKRRSTQNAEENLQETPQKLLEGSCLEKLEAGDQSKCFLTEGHNWSDKTRKS